MTQPERLTALLSAEKDATATLANAAAFLYDEFDDLNWCGFYLFSRSENCLILGPFQGKPACCRIALDRGVCGAAFSRNESLRVSDVHEFPGHIACDSASRSELVIPLRAADGCPFGVLDIDSPTLNRFSTEDQETFEALVAVIERAVDLAVRSY